MKRKPRIIQYKLIGKLPVPCSNTREWAESLESIDRQVAQDQVGGLIISTVFLGLDHNFSGGDAILFETMVFADDTYEGFSGYRERYSTWDEAEKGHAVAVQWAREQMEQIERSTVITNRETDQCT